MQAGVLMWIKNNQVENDALTRISFLWCSSTDASTSTRWGNTCGFGGGQCWKIMLRLSCYEATGLGWCDGTYIGGIALRNKSGNQSDWNRLCRKRKSDHGFNLFHRTAPRAVVLLQSRQQTERRQEKVMHELKWTTQGRWVS